MSLEFGNRELLERFLACVIGEERALELSKDIGFNLNFSEVIDTLVSYNTDILSDFLILFKRVAKTYLETAYLKKNGNKLDTSEKICDYFEISFLGATNEEIHIIGLDDELYITCEGVLNTGSPSKVSFSLRKISEFVIKNNLSRIAIAHNHPNGTCLPSDEDLICTKRLVEFLDMIDTELIDHIVVGRGGLHSIRSSLRGCGIWNK